MSYPSQAYNQPPPYGAAGQYSGPAGAYNGPAGAYNGPAGAYNPSAPYQGPPAGAYQPSYQQPQQTTVYVYKDTDREDRDRELAEDCCLLACCWAVLCCCLASNT